jgi:hypothetical protein
VDAHAAAEGELATLVIVTVVARHVAVVGVPVFEDEDDDDVAVRT